MNESKLRVYSFKYSSINKRKHIDLGIYARDKKEASLLNDAFASKYSNKYKQVEKGVFDYERTKEARSDKNFNLAGLKKEYKMLGIKFK